MQYPPDSRLSTSLEQREPREKIKYKELSVESMSTADKSQCWLNAPYNSSFYQNFSAPVMSTDMNQVGVALFPSFKHFLSFDLSRFSIYSNI